MKPWQIIIAVVLGLLFLYGIVAALVRTLVSLLIVGGIALLLGGLLTAWLRSSWKKGLPGKLQARRLESRAERALRDLKKSTPNDRRP
jgi:hypothetical protein